MEGDSTTGMLDPENSERQYYRDYAGLHREIWRPGDGDGVSTTEYLGQEASSLTVAQRWRLFQSDIGPIVPKTNEPPRFVLLDDRAAYDVFDSKISRSRIVDWWPHDFAGGGRVRTRRPHRGRGAVHDPSAEGDGRFHSCSIGTRNERYYFTGETNFTPVVYSQLAQPSQKLGDRGKRKLSLSPSPEEEKNPRMHGHNQYTPKSLLVKHGAPSLGKKPRHKRERVNRFLHKDPDKPIGADWKVPRGVIDSVWPGSRPSSFPLDRAESQEQTPERFHAGDGDSPPFIQEGDSAALHGDRNEDAEFVQEDDESLIQDTSSEPWHLRSPLFVPQDSEASEPTDDAGDGYMRDQSPLFVPQEQTPSVTPRLHDSGQKSSPKNRRADQSGQTKLASPQPMAQIQPSSSLAQPQATSHGYEPELTRLRNELQHAQDELRVWQDRAHTAEATALRHEQNIARLQSDIQTLQDQSAQARESLKEKDEKLAEQEETIGALRIGQWWK